MLTDKILTDLIDKWGMEKIIKVIASSIIGAGIAGLIAESTIPNKPSVEEKESK